MTPIWYYAHFLFLGVIVMLVLGIVALSRKRTVQTLNFYLLALSSSVYTIGYSFEITRTVPNEILFWSRFQFLGIPYIVTFLYLFVRRYVKPGRMPRRVLAPVLILLATVFTIFRYTNHRHELYYSDIRFVEMPGFVALDYNRGVVYWILVAYNVTFILLSTLLILRYLKRPSGYQNRQGIFLFGLFKADWGIS